MSHDKVLLRNTGEPSGGIRSFATSLRMLGFDSEYSTDRLPARPADHGAIPSRPRRAACGFDSITHANGNAYACATIVGLIEMPPAVIEAAYFMNFPID
jgi:hypothetical protein